ncbi:MAG: TatD family hydrolase [Chloroflexi bacterium]|nr:TatD family hydrolase [Chloroflexota bacterium]
MYQLVDTHAHVEELKDVGHAIEAAREAGLIAVVAVGMSYESNNTVLELGARYKGFVYPALGLHPWEVASELHHLQRSLSFIEDNIRSAIAIGEVGLDYDKRVRALADKDTQQAVLRDLLAIAKKYDKPVSLHNRYAWKDSITLARESGVKKVVFHWFTGFSSALSELLAAGYYISATPAAEYHQEHRRAIREAPVSRLMLETDCPVEYGREDRYASSLKDIVRSLNAVAEIRGAGPVDISSQTTQNAAIFFGLPKPA